jgi:16S rRNA (cytosine967-C5)-methyltransferase
MAAPARAAAYRVLRTIAAGSGSLGDALSHARDSLEDSRDRALVTELAAGTLRWRNAIDFQLQRLSAKPLERLDEEVLDALRLAGYQILYLERVPTSAAVNDSVDLVKRGGFKSATGFANAVLRRLVRERQALPWPDRADLVQHLAVVHSHPAWLVERWLQRYGEQQAERWLRFNNDPPALTLAANRLRNTREALLDRLSEENVVAVPTVHAPYGLRIVSGAPLGSKAFAHGRCLVQDEASQLIPTLMQAAERARVLDLCASPGGKTVALAAQCGREGVVVATDVRARRMRLLRATLERCQVQHAYVVQIPSRGPLPFRNESFDGVLIDAPCTGLGTLRRDPDIRWRRRPTDFPTLAAMQRDLLLRVRPLVRPGGRIVYSTCSSEPEENEDVLAAFLAEATDVRVISLGRAGVSSTLADMETPEGYLRTRPEFGLEMFFGAILQKAG